MNKLTLFIILLLTCLLFGCNGTSGSQAPATSDDMKSLKERMNDVFAGLEMYAQDNSSYPDTLDKIMPKYLDRVPVDPVSRQPVKYLRTEDGFLIEASGDYRSIGAEPGFPKMNQDGFYVLKQADFPTDE